MLTYDTDEDFQADLARAIALSLEPDATGPHAAGWNALLAAGRAASWGDNGGTGGRSSSPVIVDDDDDDFQRQLAAAMAASIQSAEEDQRRRLTDSSFGVWGAGASAGTGGAGAARMHTQPACSHPQPSPPQHPLQGSTKSPSQEPSQAPYSRHVTISRDGAVCCSSGLLLKPLGGAKACGFGAPGLPAVPAAGTLSPQAGVRLYPEAGAGAPEALPLRPAAAPSGCPSRSRDVRTSSSLPDPRQDPAGRFASAAAPTLTVPSAPTAAAGVGAPSSSAPLSTSPGKHARTPSPTAGLDLVQRVVKRSRPTSDSGAGTPSSGSWGAGGADATLAAGAAAVVTTAAGPVDYDGTNRGRRAGLLVGPGLGQGDEGGGWDAAPDRSHSHSPPERPASAASGCTTSVAAAAAGAALDVAVNADAIACVLPELSPAPALAPDAALDLQEPRHACLSLGGAWSSGRGVPAAAGVDQPAVGVLGPSGGYGRSASRVGGVRCSSWPPVTTTAASASPEGAARGMLWQHPHPHDGNSGDDNDMNNSRDALIGGDVRGQEEPGGRCTVDLAPAHFSPGRGPCRMQLSACEAHTQTAAAAPWPPHPSLPAVPTGAAMRRCGSADGSGSWPPHHHNYHHDQSDHQHQQGLQRGWEQPTPIGAGAGVGPGLCLGPGTESWGGRGARVGASAADETADVTSGWGAGPAPMTIEGSGGGEPLPLPSPEGTHMDVGVGLGFVEQLQAKEEEDMAVSGGQPEYSLPAAADTSQTQPVCYCYSAADRRLLLHQRVWWWLGPGQAQPGRVASIDRRSDPLLYTVRLDACDGSRDGESVIATADCLLPYLEYDDRVMCRLPPSPRPLLELASGDGSAWYPGAGAVACGWVCGRLQHCIFDAAVPLVHVLLGPEGLPLTLPYEFVVPVADAAEGSGVQRPESWWASTAGAQSGGSACMDIVPVGR